MRLTYTHTGKFTESCLVNNGSYSFLWVPLRPHMTSCHLARLSSAFLSRPEIAGGYIPTVHVCVCVCVCVLHQTNPLSQHCKTSHEVKTFISTLEMPLPRRTCIGEDVIIGFHISHLGGTPHTFSHKDTPTPTPMPVIHTL